MGRLQDVVRDPDRILDFLDGGDRTGFSVPVHQRRVHLNPAVDPHPRPGPGVQSRIVFEDHDRLDDRV